MKKQIVIKTDFPAIHSWPGCDISGMEYLRHPHRHLFAVTVKFEVTHNNRDIEFIDMKKKIDQYINSNWRDKNLGSMSCEDLAESLLRLFNASFVGVLEDGENGAEVYL